MHMEEVIYDLKRSIDRMRKPLASGGICNDPTIPEDERNSTEYIVPLSELKDIMPSSVPVDMKTREPLDVRLKGDPKRTSTEYISPLSSIEQMFADSAKQMAQDINKAVTDEVIAMMDDKQLNDDEFMAMKLNASMSRDELIELIHKLRAKINEMTPLRPINTYGPDFKPAPPKRTMKELEGETPIQGI